MMDRYDGERMLAALAAPAKEALERRPDVFAEIESTSSYLMAEVAPPVGKSRVALADCQTAGRGRHNNHWHSPPASGLYLSMAYTFAAMPRHFSCLTLAIGVGVANLLKSLGADSVQLKWPNDLIFRDGKLGGILTELQPGQGEAVTVVVGIGVNIDVAGKLDDVTTRVGRIADLAEAMGSVPDRESIAVGVIERLIETLQQFETHGFELFHRQWDHYDWLKAKSVQVNGPAKKLRGIAVGIDTDGALLLQAGGEMNRITSGTVLLPGQAGPGR